MIMAELFTKAQAAWNSGMSDEEAKSLGFEKEFDALRDKYGCACIPLRDLLGPKRVETPRPLLKQKPEKVVIIRYTIEQEPVEGNPINAAFSGAQCLTRCSNSPTIKVGSLSCERCKSFGGREAFAVSTGIPPQYGGTSEHRKIYCKDATG
jgi:hypothetical protein